MNQAWATEKELGRKLLPALSSFPLHSLPHLALRRMAEQNVVEDLVTETVAPGKAKKRRFLGYTALVERHISAHELTEYFSERPEETYEMVMSQKRPCNVWTVEKAIESVNEGEKEEELKKCVETMVSFKTDPYAVTLSYDGVQAPKANSAQRVVLHERAEALNLCHESIGKGELRILILSKPWPVERGDKQVLPEYFVASTYIGLKGAMVERVAEKYGRYLTESVKEKRKARDGPLHHITILAASSLSSLLDYHDPEALFSRLAREVSDDWTPAGLGMASNSDGLLSFFVICLWPSASLFLHSIRAPPQSFHITLGFQLNDVHGVEKNLLTLVPPSDLASLALLEALPEPKKPTNPKKSKKATPLLKQAQNISFPSSSSSSSQ